jgi:hypothetical protein
LRQVPIFLFPIVVTVATLLAIVIAADASPLSEHAADRAAPAQDWPA